MERKQMNYTDDKQRDAVSDTPRTDTVAFGTDDESLNRLFGIRELPRYVAPADFARQLERELAAVTAERDVLRADLCTFAVDMEKQLSASQQEVRRLKVLLAAIQQDYNHPWTDEDAGNSSHRTYYLAKITDALSSIPSPVHKDTERLITVQTELLILQFQLSGYLLSIACNDSRNDIIFATLRRAQSAIDAELAKEGK